MTFRGNNKLFGYVGGHGGDGANDHVDLSDNIEKVIPHPQWNRMTRNADIALIRLKTELKFNGKLLTLNVHS